MRVYRRNYIDVVVGGTDEEAVVDVRLACCVGILVVECLERCGLRIGVGHIEIGRDTAKCSCTAFRFDVGLLCQSGVAEVHMVVNHTW